MKTIEVTLYEFDELSDNAKEKAREWWRESEAQEFGNTRDFYDDIVETAGLLGITFSTHPVPLMSGKTSQWPDIWWQLHVQGSGASFAGRYEHKEGMRARVMKERPEDAEIQRIARALTAIQGRYGYQLTAKITADARYTHSNGMSVECFDRHGNTPKREATAGDVLQLMKDFADYIYKWIDAEYASRMSDENVDECIRGNDYTFRADGRRSDD